MNLFAFKVFWCEDSMSKIQIVERIYFDEESLGKERLELDYCS